MMLLHIFANSMTGDRQPWRGEIERMAEGRVDNKGINPQAVVKVFVGIGIISLPLV